MAATGISLELHEMLSRVSLKDAALIIPTFNCAKHWKDLAASLERQGLSRDQILVVDSSSTDGTKRRVLSSGYELRSIPSASFRHGATRQLASTWVPWARYLVYLTQDSIPADDDSIQTLLKAFEDPSVGAAYGRQIPRQNAGPIERHARLFNYPPESDVRTYDSRKELGIRAAFFSNSFAAYRRTALDEVGGFPKNTIVSEDVQVAALLLRAGWKTKYQSNAIAIHSHQLSLRQEFSRYFDIGVHHSRESWLMKEFGKRQGEGLAFVLSELKYLSKGQKALIPAATIRNLNKYLSYHLGLNERHLNTRVKRAISAQEAFWLDEIETSKKDREEPVESRNENSSLRKAV